MRLRRLLRVRHPLASDDLASSATDLAARLGLRRHVPVSTVPQLEVPLATGVLRPEVCLPARALEELEGEQQVALCAHELAHVARRDPTWILAARLVEAGVPIQPLNAWARRRLQDLAECLSDDLAVAASGRPLGLARSLVDVASWTVAEPIPLPAASGALSARSRLGHRVERLMDPLRSLERPRRFLLPVAAVAVLATALVTPVVSGNPGAEPPPVQEPVEATAPHVASAALLAPAAPAAPVPPAAPSAPAVPEAPEAPEVPEAPHSDAALRLEELTRTIEQRVEAQHTAMTGIEAEIQSLVQESLPNQEELERLGREVEVAARTLAASRRAAHEGTAHDETARQEVEEARRQLREAQKEMREAVRAVRVPEDQMRLVRERVREIVEATRPTPEERDEIRRLAREVARESMPDMSELHETRAHTREAVREARHALHEATRAARETVREAREAAREAEHEAREAAREAREEAREERHREPGRDSEHERTRSLEEAEESHLEEREEEPESDEP